MDERRLPSMLTLLDFITSWTGGDLHGACSFARTA